MSVIVYRKHSFKEPGPITLDQFTSLKRQIVAGADFEIDRDFKTTFTARYKKNIRWFFIGAVVCIGALGLYQAFFDFVPGQFGWPEILRIIFVIAGGGTALFTLVQILLEGPSMATRLTDQRLYFLRMKHAIRHETDYAAFYTTFYGDGKKKPIGDNAPFRQEALQELWQGPRSVDYFLTRTFYLIDQHFWKLVLAAGAIFLIKKYLI